MYLRSISTYLPSLLPVNTKNPNSNEWSCTGVWQKWNVCRLQRFERLRPWLSGQRAGHGAGRWWGGDGRLHWGQVRFSLSDFLDWSFSALDKTIDSHTLNQLQNKDCNQFFTSSCRFPRALCVWKPSSGHTLAKACHDFFFWPRIYLHSDFVASSKAIFIPLLTHIWSRLLCWHWIYTVRRSTFFVFTNEIWLQALNTQL